MPFQDKKIEIVNLLEEFNKIRKGLPEGFLPGDVESIFNKVSSLVWPKTTQTIVHMDFHGRNILFDGNNFFVIDWEMAGCSHPFVDVADFTNSYLVPINEGHEMLATYLKRSPTKNELLEFDTLRKIISGFRAIFSFFQAGERGFQYSEFTKNELGQLMWQNLDEGFKIIDSGQFNGASSLHWYNFGLIIARETVKLFSF